MAIWTVGANSIISVRTQCISWSAELAFVCKYETLNQPVFTDAWHWFQISANCSILAPLTPYMCQDSTWQKEWQMVANKIGSGYSEQNIPLKHLSKENEWKRWRAAILSSPNSTNQLLTLLEAILTLANLLIGTNHHLSPFKLISSTHTFIKILWHFFFCKNTFLKGR